MSNVIKGEVQFLKDRNLGFIHPDNVVIALRSTMNQIMTCFVTSGHEHAMHLVRRLGGHIQFHWDHTGAKNEPRPTPKSQEFGTWLIMIDRAISTAQEMAHRRAIGDVQSQFMFIMSLTLGLIEDYGVIERQGYEVSKD